MSRCVPATGILTELPLARLKPAVGEMCRQAPPKPRAGEKRSSRPEYQMENPGKARDRQQVTELQPGVRLGRTRDRGIEGSKDRVCGGS